jgi:hypothetical protein
VLDCLPQKSSSIRFIAALVPVRLSGTKKGTGTSKNKNKESNLIINMDNKKQTTSHIK